MPARLCPPVSVSDKRNSSGTRRIVIVGFLALATMGSITSGVFGWRPSSQDEVRREKPGEKPAIAQLAFHLGDRVTPDLSKTFMEKVDVMLPMRDGIKLHTEIYAPRFPHTSGSFPIMLERTPYYANPNEDAYSSRLKFYTEFFDDDYIWVLQDLRGRYRSEGVHVELRPQRDKTVPGSTDESTDFYDTIDWLVKNVPNNNGRVGTLGISYGGFLATAP